MGVLRIRFTEEEKEEFKQTLLDILPSGDNDMQIADNLGVSAKMISNYIKILIEEGKTTQLAVDKAREEKTQNERNKKKAKVLEGLKRKDTKSSIKKAAQISDPMLETLTNELIKERRNNRRRGTNKKKPQNKQA